MSWSYDPTAIEKGLNFIRLMVGDTDTSDQQISDEEINAILAIEVDKWRAAAVVADGISAKYARYGASEEAERFRVLADLLRVRAGARYL